MQGFGMTVWRVLKIVPVVGIAFVIAGAPAILRRKGYILGALALTLDLLPLICLIKAGVEIFTGDLIPDKFETNVEAGFEPAAWS